MEVAKKLFCLCLILIRQIAIFEYLGNGGKPLFFGQNMLSFHCYFLHTYMLVPDNHS